MCVCGASVAARNIERSGNNEEGSASTSIEMFSPGNYKMLESLLQQADNLSKK